MGDFSVIERDFETSEARICLIFLPNLLRLWERCAIGEKSKVRKGYIDTGPEHSLLIRCTLGSGRPVAGHWSPNNLSLLLLDEHAAFGYPERVNSGRFDALRPCNAIFGVHVVSQTAFSP